MGEGACRHPCLRGGHWAPTELRASPTSAEAERGETWGDTDPEAGGVELEGPSPPTSQDSDLRAPDPQLSPSPGLEPLSRLPSAQAVSLGYPGCAGRSWAKAAVCVGGAGVRIGGQRFPWAAGDLGKLLAPRAGRGSKQRLAASTCSSLTEIPGRRPLQSGALFWDVLIWGF